MQSHQSFLKVTKLYITYGGQVLFEDNKTPEITSEQVKEAIYNLRNGTALGYDGLTAEHGRTAIQHIVESAKIRAVSGLGIITFLPKPDKPDNAYANPTIYNDLAHNKQSDRKNYCERSDR